MYHVSRIDDARATPPDDYRGHSTGFRRQDVIGREFGSHHMTMSAATLEPGGRVDAAVHSYEKSLWMLGGELTLSMLDQTLTLRRNDCAVVPVAVAHRLAAGSTGARWLEMSAPVRLLPSARRRDTFFLPDDVTFPGGPAAPASRVDLRDPRNRHVFRFDEGSMDLGRLARGSDPAAPEVSASMATAMLAYSGIGIRMLADQRTSAQLHTMFMVEYQPTAVAHPHDHPFEEAYVFTSGETEAVVEGEHLVLRPGDVLWTGSGCEHAFYNRTEGKTQWIETQAPQPPARHSYRFSRDWEYLAEKLCAGTRVEPVTGDA